MTGHATWLAALSRRLVHRDTFELMVSPAIADLDTERASGWRTYLRHGSGFVVVFAAALLRDWRSDVRTAFDVGSRRDVWRVTAIWYTAPSVLLAALLLKTETPWHLLDAIAGTAVVVDTILSARLYASYVAVIAAVFLLSRRMSSLKALVIGAAVVSFVFAATNAASSVIRVPLNRTIYDTSSRNLATAVMPSGEPSWERSDGRKWVEWRGRQATRKTTLIELLGWLAVAPLAAVFNFLPFGLIGTALARGRGATVAFRLAAVIGTAVTIHLLTMNFEEPQFIQFLKQMGALTAAALLGIGAGPGARLIVGHLGTLTSGRTRTRQA
jgi:hypothetical protein